MSRTRQQEQAQYAWNCIDEAKNGNINFSEYTQILQGSGAMILSCGLGQTVAFYFSQSGSHYKLILQQWAKMLGIESKEQLIESLMSDSSSYRYKTNQILSLLDWMKRFSKGVGQQ